jgi:hypothetical protein
MEKTRPAALRAIPRTTDPGGLAECVDIAVPRALIREGKEPRLPAVARCKRGTLRFAEDAFLDATVLGVALTIVPAPDLAVALARRRRRCSVDAATKGHEGGRGDLLHTGKGGEHRGLVRLERLAREQRNMAARRGVPAAQSVPHDPLGGEVAGEARTLPVCVGGEAEDEAEVEFEGEAGGVHSCVSRERGGNHRPGLAWHVPVAYVEAE